MLFLKKNLTGQSSPIWSMKESLDGDLISGSENGTIQIWKLSIPFYIKKKYFLMPIN
jgi:hypothetical protein